MPINNNLEKVKFPMPIRFGEKQKTEFKNNIEAIKVSLVQAPTMEELRKYIPDFTTATWEDNAMHNKYLDDKQKDKLIYMAFMGKLLPSALETIKLQFCFENVSYQDLSHILRYRTGTYSVECSADKWWNNKNAVVPTSIENSDEIYEEFKDLVIKTKELYVKMLDTKKISLIDARYILPRCMETYVWASFSLKDILHLIDHRIDKQIQPDSDNVLAYKIIEELLKYYPLLVNKIDIHKPSYFYVHTARTGRCTNLFMPDKDSDIYEYNEEDYVYGTTRDNVNGTNENCINKFKPIFERCENVIKETKQKMLEEYGEDFFKLEL